MLHLQECIFHTAKQDVDTKTSEYKCIWISLVDSNDQNHH